MLMYRLAILIFLLATLAVAGKDPRLYASAEQGQRAVEFPLERMTRLLCEALELLPASAGTASAKGATSASGEPSKTTPSATG